LITHLKEHHVELYTKALSAQNSSHQDSQQSSSSSQPLSDQPTTTDVIEATKKFNAKSPRMLKLDRAVAHFIAKDELPFYTVEKPEFRTLVAKLNPRYKLLG